MTDLSSLLSSLLVLAAVYLAVLASPGPNFFILSQMALDGRRSQARWVVLGLSTGSIVWVVLSIAGLSTLLGSHPWIATVVRSLGAAYLVWYGARLLRAAFAPRQEQPLGVHRVADPGSRLGAYRTGLLTGLTNPKGAAFWTSAFAAILPADAPTWFLCATVALVALLSLGWHLGITLVFGIPSLRATYLRFERAVNGVAGGALVMLGVHRFVAR